MLPVSRPNLNLVCSQNRSYTPVTGDETVGTVSFVIKIYRANVHPRFPKGGKMSQHLDTLKVGDFLNMKGPKGHLEYLGRGKFSVKQMRKPVQVRQAKHFAMLAGGTGITPMLQVIQAIFRDDKDVTTTIGLVYANQSKFSGYTRNTIFFSWVLDSHFRYFGISRFLSYPGDERSRG